VGLIEVNELAGDTSASTLANISTRGQVLTGDDVMIGGFIITGTASKQVLIRVRGGSLGDVPFFVPGVLVDPLLELYSGSTKIAQNDDWETTDPLCLAPAESCGDATAISAATFLGTSLNPCAPNPGETTAPAGCTQESAIFVTLPPGAYTAIVQGVSGGTGVGLVEVNEPD